MTKQEQMIADMATAPSVELRTWLVGRTLIGYKRATDYWASIGKSGEVVQHFIDISRVVDEDDAFLRVIVGKTSLMFSRLPPKVTP